MSWWLKVVNAHRAYDAGFAGRGVNLGVLDSGLNDSHREFRGRTSGHSLDVDSDGPVTGDTSGKNGHGTGVAAVAVANRDRFGIHGVAYGAVVTPIHDGKTSGLDDALSKTYAYLPGIGAELLNLSSGVGLPAPYLLRKEADSLSADLLPAARRGVADGILTVVSAGNSRYSQPDFIAGLPYFYPELEKGWLAVVASRSDDRLTSYSQACGVAARWCIAAPGGDVEAPDGSFKLEYFVLPSASGGYYYSVGTSYATPLVTGALAVTREIFPNAAIGELRALILRTAVDTGKPGIDQVFGWGRLDLGNVVETISPVGRSIFANAAQTRQLSIDQVARLPFGSLVRSSRNKALWATGRVAHERFDAARSGEVHSQGRAYAAGLDLMDQQSLTAGLGVALTHARTMETNTANTAMAEGLFGFGYANWSSGRWYAKGTSGAGYLLQMHRRRSIPGLAGTAMQLLRPEALSRTKGQGIFAALETGHRFDAGPVEIILSGRVSASRHNMKAFRESGLDILAYTVDAGRLTMAQAGSEVRLSRAIKHGAWILHPEVGLSYARAMGDAESSVGATLLARRMKAQTAALGRDILGASASLSLRKPESGVSVRLGVRGAFRRNARHSSMQFNLSLAF